MKSTAILSSLSVFTLLGIISCSQGGISTSAAVPAVIVEATPKSAAKSADPAKPQNIQTAVFAGGCFWGIEAVFEHTKGVTEAKSGYAGGDAKTAKYDLVSGGDTGHAEAVQVKFDANQVTYKQLLQIFFSVAHDPTQLDRQGPDAGTQYRSELFTINDDQTKEAKAYVNELTSAKTFSQPIVTKISTLEKFYEAEKYHQDYMKKNPDDGYIVYHDKPKVENLKKQFPDLYVER